MADRTVRVGSAGKTFSFTAWKVCLPLVVSVPMQSPGVQATTQLCALARTHHRTTPLSASSLQHAEACGLDHMNILSEVIADRVEPSQQIGWVTGPAPLVSAVGKAHQFVTFTVASSLQRAVAYGLDNEAVFYTCVCSIAASARSTPVH